MGITAIFVTHDQVEALAMCDKVLVMNQGRVEQLGTPVELYETPKTAFVAGFVGRTNRFKAVARSGMTDFAGQKVTAPRNLDGPVLVMIRPHRLGLAPAAAPVRAHEPGLQTTVGTVKRAIFAGDILQYDVEAGGQMLSVEIATRGGERVIEAGETVSLSWRPEDIFVYGAAA